ELARLASRPATPVAPPSSLGRELGLAVIAVSVVVPLSHRFQHPSVRTLNLGESAIQLYVDDRRVGRVEASTVESPLAGLEVRVPAGRRRFVSRDAAGRAVADIEVDVEAGSRHLYAPGSDSVCFWLETTGYGRDRTRREVFPLTSDKRFWAIPD